MSRIIKAESLKKPLLILLFFIASCLVIYNIIAFNSIDLGLNAFVLYSFLALAPYFLFLKMDFSFGLLLAQVASIFLFFLIHKLFKTKDVFFAQLAFISITLYYLVPLTILAVERPQLFS